MADSASLIGLNIATGGGASVLLSTSMMGSRAYVSTLNDALDRGVSDGAAVALAFSSATVESAMESYSLGHLMNLEESLSVVNKNLISKISNNITNPTLSKITKNSLYIGMGAISQGLCEGEEEFATEILNHYADELISGNLSSYNQTISEYVQLGYSEEKARIEADKIYMNQLYQAFLGGFASGVCFGSFGAGYDTHKKSQIMANNIIENNQSLSINSDSFSEPSLNFNAQNDINLNLTNNNYNTEANQITSSNQQKNNSETVIKFNKNFSFIERIRFKNNLKNVSSAEPYQAFEQALKNAKNCEDSSVRTIIKNLYKLKVLRPDFKLDYSKNGGAWSEFASGNIYLTPSRIIYKMDTVIYHELGHTLHSAINSSKIPKNYNNILDTVENEIFNKKEYAASITNFMNDLFENYEKEATKKIDLEEIKSEVSAEMQLFSIDNLAEDLKSVGLSDEVIKKIESKKYKERFDELVEHKKQKKIVEYCDIEAQKEGIAPVSDIICSLFYGKESLDYYDSEIGQRVKIGSNLRLGHSKEYFKSKSNPTEASFHEQMANYIQLKFTNNTKYLEMIQNLLGQEWTNAMEKMYNNIVNYFANETVDLEQINEIAQDSQLEKTDELPQINNDEIFEKTEELPQLNNDEIFEKTEELPLININKQFDTIFSEPQFLGSSSSKTNYNSTYNQSYDYNYTLNYIVDIINRKYGNGIDYIKAYYEKNDSSFITKEGDCRYYIEQIPKEVIGAYLGYNINSNNNQNYNYDNNTNVSNQNSIDILNYIIDILNRKYGDGLERLRIYYEKSDLSVITREGECRDYIQQVSKEDLAAYLGYNINTNNNENYNYDNNINVSNQNSTDILNYIIDILNRKYGDGLERLRNYYENGSLSVITREGNCRDYIQQISKEDLAAYLGYDINKNSNQNYNYDNNANISTQNREILDYIFELINRKYGDGFVRLKAYCDNGNLSVIPNEGNCSDYIQQIPKEDILTYLGYDINVIKNLQDKDTRINKIFDEMPNPIQNYSVLDKIVSKYFLNNGGSLYCNLVSVNTPRTKYAPTLDQITRFNNRFIYSGKYNAIAQGNAFIHIKSKQELDNINHRLYINADYHMTYAFAEAFANKCESRNIPFYFKTMPFNGEINEFGLYRDESIVIYSDDNYFADYVEICREIKNEFAGFELMPPPVFSGLIDGWIGYGGENKTDHSKSFNQIRTQIIAESMQKTMEYYQITDIKSLKRHKRRYKKFLDLLFQNIYYICSNYGVSPDNFAITTN